MQLLSCAIFFKPNLLSSRHGVWFLVLRSPLTAKKEYFPNLIMSCSISLAPVSTAGCRQLILAAWQKKIRRWRWLKSAKTNKPPDSLSMNGCSCLMHFSPLKVFLMRLWSLKTIEKNTIKAGAAQQKGAVNEERGREKKTRRWNCALHCWAACPLLSTWEGGLWWGVDCLWAQVVSPNTLKVAYPLIRFKCYNGK